MMQSDVPHAPRRKRKPRARGKADPSSAVTIQRAERDAEALRLRTAGKSLTFIASTVEGFHDASHVSKTISEQLRRMKAEPASELAALYVRRLEKLLEVAWEKAEAGDLEALRECRSNVMDTAKLLGLVKTKVDVEVSPPREALWERVSGWLTDPTPELEAALERAGWVRVAGSIEAKGEDTT